MKVIYARETNLPVQIPVNNIHIPNLPACFSFLTNNTNSNSYFISDQNPAEGEI